MKPLLTYAFLVACVLPAVAFAAADRGSEPEAEAMVKKAVAYIKSAGAEKAYKVITEHTDGAPFKDRDLYVFVYDFTGVCQAQGANPKLLGKNLMEARDADGKYHVKSMIEMVRTSKKGWFGPYRWVNPSTNDLEYKKSYCEQGAGETMVCVGIHWVQK